MLICEILVLMDLIKSTLLPLNTIAKKNIKNTNDSDIMFDLMWSSIDNRINRFLRPILENWEPVLGVCYHLSRSNLCLFCEQHCDVILC